MTNPEKGKAGFFSLKHFVWALAVTGTVAVSGSMLWSAIKEKEITLEMARIQARAAFWRHLGEI